MEPVKRLLPETRGNFFLLGPRGTGKSTLLQDHYPGAAKIDLLDAAEYRSYLAQPERLSDFVETYKSRQTIIIDEIQRVPELLPMVHKLIESAPSVRFILTGSSSRKLRKTGVDLLGGRAGFRKMHPFIAAELGESFTLARALEIGMLPLVWSSENQAQTLRGYINLYLEQEIRAESMIRRLDSFARFLETLSFSHGNLLSLSEIARECEVKRSTVDNYLEIVEELLIGTRVPIFSRRAKRSLVTHSKFYFFDCGVFRSLRPQGPIDKPEELSGQTLEGLVYQHLQAWLDYSASDGRLYFWRTASGVEVDFVVYGSNRFWAIEVKNSATIRRADLRPLKSFLEDYPECSAFFLYRGTRTLRTDKILCLPVETFLRRLNPQANISAEAFVQSP